MSHKKSDRFTSFHCFPSWMLKFQISCGFSFSFSHIKLGMLPFCVHVPSKKQACKRTPQSKFKEKLFAWMRELITLSLSIKIPQPITYMSCMHCLACDHFGSTKWIPNPSINLKPMHEVSTYGGATCGLGWAQYFAKSSE